MNMHIGVSMNPQFTPTVGYGTDDTADCPAPTDGRSDNTRGSPSPTGGSPSPRSTRWRHPGSPWRHSPSMMIVCRSRGCGRSHHVAHTGSRPYSWTNHGGSAHSATTRPTRESLEAVFIVLGSVY